MTDATLRAAQLPEKARAAWTGKLSRPVTGQVWRARWDDASTLVLLFDTSRSQVTAAPVTAEVDLATDAATVLSPELTTIGTTLIVWDRLAHELPTCVLDRRLGELTAADSLQVAPRGTAATRPAHPAVEEQARLEDVLDILADATWAPAGSGQLKQLLDTAGVTTAQVRDLPGVKPAEALALRRGERPVAGPQVEALVALTGTPAESWWAANPLLPVALVEELDQPSARASILALAEQDRRSEVEERLTVAYDLFALAARQTGQARAEDWAGRLRQYLAGRGQEEPPW